MMTKFTNEYTPDSWVVLKLKPSKGSFPIYKVLGGWDGRTFLDGDSWRMNSGITGVEKQAYLWGFYGASGSVYWCHQGGYGLSMSTTDLYCKLKKQEQFDGQVQLMPEETDWTNVKW